MRLDDARSVRRLEDVRFLTGRGRYAEDFTLPGEVRGYLVRSPHGHAAIDRIDTAAARGAPGVLGVFTEADLRADGIGPLPCVAQVNTVDPINCDNRHMRMHIAHVEQDYKVGPGRSPNRRAILGARAATWTGADRFFAPESS